MSGVCTYRKPCSLEELVRRLRGVELTRATAAMVLRARAQVRDRAQELERVPLLLQQVLRVGARADDLERGRLELAALLAARRLAHDAAHGDRRARRDLAERRGVASSSAIAVGSMMHCTPLSDEPSFTSTKQNFFCLRIVRTQPFTVTSLPSSSSSRASSPLEQLAHARNMPGVTAVDAGAGARARLGHGLGRRCRPWPPTPPRQSLRDRRGARRSAAGAHPSSGTARRDEQEAARLRARAIGTA